MNRSQPPNIRSSANLVPHSVDRRRWGRAFAGRAASSPGAGYLLQHSLTTADSTRLSRPPRERCRNGISVPPAANASCFLSYRNLSPWGRAEGADQPVVLFRAGAAKTTSAAGSTGKGRSHLAALEVRAELHHAQRRPARRVHRDQGGARCREYWTGRPTLVRCACEVPSGPSSTPRRTPAASPGRPPHTSGKSRHKVDSAPCGARGWRIRPRRSGISARRPR